MKDETTTYLFDDGTEPTVRRVPRGCDQQGRYPEAAEAATEIGQDESNFYGLEFWKLEVTDALIFAIGLLACAGAVVLVFGGGAA
jgi:hypothetical protein